MLERFKSRFSGYLYVAVAAIIWGSNGVIVNQVAYDAQSITFFRVIFASLTLLPVVLITQRSEVITVAKSWKSWNIMLGLGLMLTLGWALLFQSMKLIAIANAVFLNYTAPIFATLLIPLLLKEKLEKSTLIALVISVGGILLISFQQGLRFGGDQNQLGIVLGLLAGLAYAGFVILSKKALSSFSNQVVAFYSYSIASVFLLPFVIGIDFPPDLHSLILLMILGILNTGFAVTFYLKGLNLIKAQKAVVLTYLEPASAVVFGLIFLSQTPTPLMILGGSLILVAGYIVSRR
ncbi:MAG: DMT family transporter [Dehalococcoidales bacterium]|nr:DMT family transporter [Dehalococcoidales bacterium]